MQLNVIPQDRQNLVLTSSGPELANLNDIGPILFRI